MKKTMWALFDDRMGSVGQAKGIILALAERINVFEKKIVYNKFAKLPNCFKGRSLLGMNKQESSSLEGPWPDLVLSISRRTTPIARWIKKQSGNKTKIVQLMHPGKSGLKDIDLVVVSEHDAKKCKGNNFMFITGCPHRIFEKTLSEAKAQWESVFAKLPKPLVSVLIGGAIKGKEFSLENAKKLGQSLKALHKKSGGSFLITTSRRTGIEAEKIILNEISNIPTYTYLWGEKKENPIMGFYACADKIVVTGDSVSMVSEACGSGCPVLIFEGSEWLTAKHLRFIRSLYDGNYACPLDSDKALSFKPDRHLNPAQEIAAKILEIR